MNTLHCFQSKLFHVVFGFFELKLDCYLYVCVYNYFSAKPQLFEKLQIQNKGQRQKILNEFVKI